MKDENALPKLAETALDPVDEGPEDGDPSDDEPVVDPEIDEYYWKLRQFVEMVAEAENDALLIEAPPGLGKTYQINRALLDSVGREGYRHMAGYVTPAELYHALYDTRNDKVLFLDDIRGVVSSKTSMSILKQATWSDDGRRLVEWRSTSSKIQAPEQFEYRGRIIMCFNEVPDNEIFQSLKSRALQYHMDFTYEQRIHIMNEIAKRPYKSLDLDERREVADWIEQNTIPGARVDLRVLFHVMDCRDFESERWRELASDFVGADEELMVVNRLLDEHDTVEAAAEAYENETGKTRRTFFRKKKQIDKDQ